MKYNHIVWDWNGTLLDDRWLCIEAINFVLKSRKMKLVSNEEYRDLFCFPVIDYYEKLGFDFTKEHFPIPEFLEYYKNKFEECSLHKNAEFVLKKISESGFTQSVLSAGKQSSLLNWVKYHNIEFLFDQIIGVDNEEASGKIDAGKSWLNSSTIIPEQTLLLGDTIHDKEVAEALGFKCVLIDIGHVSNQRLAATGETVISELVSIIDYLNID